MKTSAALSLVESKVEQTKAAAIALLRKPPHVAGKSNAIVITR
ncbi:MAG: hypothetical protein ABIV48_11760 [Pyrinomonadaceae bacterium]